MKNKVLVIDDRLKAIDGVRDILEMEGYHVLTASNVIDAYKIVSLETPDLIVSDLNMPELTGFDFLKKMSLIEKYNKIPIIILSAISDNHTIKKSLRLHASAYLIKPCSADELIETVKSVLN